MYVLYPLYTVYRCVLKKQAVGMKEHVISAVVVYLNFVLLT
jgi:hypothetical protein